MERILFMVYFLVLATGLAVQPAYAQGGGDAAKGKSLWQNHACKRCHGENGEGKYAGPRAGDGKKADDWIKQVRTPRRNMPSFTPAQVSDADLSDMWAYMQTLPKPASFTPPPFTPVQGDLPGKVLFYEKRCVACHGDGKAMVKARFTDKGRALTSAEVIKSLRAPAKMPHYSDNQVKDEEAGQITEYLLK